MLNSTQKAMRSGAKVAAQVLLLMLLFALPQGAQAGDKLRKLKEDVLRVQKGTLLIAPIMPDSFVLSKLEGPARDAYMADLRLSQENLVQAMAKHYRFSRTQVMPAFSDYPSYLKALSAYDGQRYFVLQFGQMAQFAQQPSKRASNYDKEFLGIYATDGRERIYLNPGKLKLFPKLAYAESIVKSLDTNLNRYARSKRKGEKISAPRLLAPTLTGKVAILPQERLYGNDSLTFLDGQYQTVVTTLPLKLFRAFGGVAMPGGSFVSPDTIRDTAATRADLAILMAWGNTLEFEAVINVPPATKLNVGLAAPQIDLPGGGEQVIMPFKWNLDWIDRIYSLRGPQSWTLAEFRVAFPQYFPTK